MDNNEMDSSLCDRETDQIDSTEPNENVIKSNRKGKMNGWHLFMCQLRKEGFTSTKKIKDQYNLLSASEKEALKEKALNMSEEEIAKLYSVNPKPIILEDNTQVYRCESDECGQVFPSRYRCRQHISHCRFLGNNHRFPCELCHRVLKTETLWKLHIKKAHRQKVPAKVKSTRTRKHPLTPSSIIRDFSDICPDDSVSSTCGTQPTNEFDRNQIESAAKQMTGEPQSDGGLSSLSCDQTVLNKQSVPAPIRRHMRDELGNTSGKFDCGECGASFKLSKQLKSHKLRYHQKSQSVDVEDEQQDILSENSSNDIFQCEDCGKDVKSLGGIKRHYKMQHGKNLEIEELIELKKEANSDEEQEVHAKQDQCSYCGTVFESEDAMNGHLKGTECVGNHWSSSASANQSTSEVKQLTRSRASNSSVRSLHPKHTGSKPRRCTSKISCVLCDKRFFTPTALLNHYNHHHKIAPKYLDNIASIFDTYKNSIRYFRPQDLLNMNNSHPNQFNVLYLDDVLRAEEEIEVTTCEDNSPNHKISPPTRNITGFTCSSSEYAANTCSSVPNGSFAINGLDDLLTFESGAQSTEASAADQDQVSHNVCKICYQTFVNWQVLSSHYSTVHKLQVLSHAAP